MDNLTIGELLMSIAKFGNDLNLTQEELNKVPVFIGKDDELNGIHTAWYAQCINKDNLEDKGFFELIEDGNNVTPNKISFLIS